MDANVSVRFRLFMKTGHYTQAAIAEKSGVNYQNLSKYLNGKMPWTDRVVGKISRTFNLNYDWLSDGLGEMYADEKRDGEKNYRELVELQDKALGGVSVNTIHGDNNSGTQTIGTPDATREEVAALKAKVAMLEKIIEDKNGYIDFLQGIVKQKSNLQ